MKTKQTKTNEEQVELDETDRRILLEFRTNCRRSYRELSGAIGISPAGLIERVKRLEKSGVIKAHVSSLDFLKIGYEFMGVVDIRIESGHLLEAQEKISKLRGVYAVYDVTGDHDSLALVLCKSRNELSALIKKILSIPHVQRTNTSIVLNVVKDPFEFREI
ncbi:MAG: Lrp/AsnC family transcriptional regulator [Candidatus Micrarchaeota archaeon]